MCDPYISYLNFAILGECKDFHQSPLIDLLAEFWTYSMINFLQLQRNIRKFFRFYYQNWNLCKNKMMIKLFGELPILLLDKQNFCPLVNYKALQQNPFINYWLTVGFIYWLTSLKRKLENSLNFDTKNWNLCKNKMTIMRSIKLLFFIKV